MAPVVVVEMTATEARTRRKEIVDLLGGNEERLRDRAANYQLDWKEMALFDELENLDWLLSGENQ